MLNHFKCCMVFLHKMTYLTKNVTVQPCISYIHKPASELSVAALQLMFTHFRNERLFYHKKVLNNTMNKLIVLPIIFLWLNCYYCTNISLINLFHNYLFCGKIDICIYKSDYIKHLITYNHDWRDISVKNPIFHTQDLCLCTLGTNLICKKCVQK